MQGTRLFDCTVTLKVLLCLHVSRKPCHLNLLLHNNRFAVHEFAVRGVNGLLFARRHRVRGDNADDNGDDGEHAGDGNGDPECARERLDLPGAVFGRLHRAFAQPAHDAR